MTTELISNQENVSNRSINSLIQILYEDLAEEGFIWEVELEVLSIVLPILYPRNHKMPHFSVTAINTPKRCW